MSFGAGSGSGLQLSGQGNLAASTSHSREVAEEISSLSNSPRAIKG
jgi:hypothetical protein